jgi:hypothetical protein
MPRYEETRRFVCQNSSGRSIVMIEQQKSPAYSLVKSDKPIYDYMTEDGEIAAKLENDQYLLLLSDEVFHVA